MNLVEDAIKKAGFDTIKLVYRADEQKLDPYDFDDADGEAATDNVRCIVADVVGIVNHDNDESVSTALGYIEGYLYRFNEADEDHEHITMDTADFNGDVHAGAAVLEKLVHDFDFKQDCFGCTGLYIHEIRFDPKYRGRGLASMAIRRFIEWQSDLFAVATCPMTTLCDPRPETPEPPYANGLRITRREQIKASPEQRKLIAWCERLGFKPAESDSDSEFMVLNMNDYRRIRWAQIEKKKRAQAKVRSTSTI